LRNSPDQLGGAIAGRLVHSLSGYQSTFAIGGATLCAWAVLAWRAGPQSEPLPVLTGLRARCLKPDEYFIGSNLARANSYEARSLSVVTVEQAERDPEMTWHSPLNCQYQGEGSWSEALLQP
jgi:hypothetical protein